MRQLIVRQLDYDLTPVAGLALVGQYLKAVQPVLSRLDAVLPVKGGVANRDIVRSYLGLLVQGKSDFDAIENFRGDAFYKQALGIGLLPSSPTLRQRMDARASEMFDFAAPMIETLLIAQRVDYGVLPCGWLPLDVDTFAMDNGGTAKEGVGRTYAGVDGYCPLAAYLGSHGFCLELALRPGVQHSASETDFNLERVIPMAQRLSAAGAQAPILTRLPSGKFDTNYLVCQLAALAMNILRLMGQRGLLGPDAPVRHSAKRRRIKTVMQELIYRAARLIEHGRRIILGLGANDRAATIFTRMHAQFAATP